MKQTFLRCSLIVQLFVLAYAFASTAADSIEIENIPFENKYQEKFTLIPVHKLGEEKFSKGYFNLMSNEAVYKFYEGGAAKTMQECTQKYKNISQRFERWHGDQLGWVAIVDDAQNFQGFIGAYINRAGGSIEVCIALSPGFQRQKVAANALMSFFQYFWPRLKDEVKAKIKEVRAPINPSNLASLGLAKFFKQGCIEGREYTSPYYTDRPMECRKRQDAVILIEDLLKILAKRPD